MSFASLLRLATTGWLGGVLAPNAQASVQMEIEWTACGDAGLGVGAQCASVEMPLFHERPRHRPDGPSILVAVKRILAPEESRRQLWFLDGGPGDAGRESLGRLARLLDDRYLDLYTADHRGVGGTALLSCPTQQSPDSPDGREITHDEWRECIEHIGSTRPDLDGLTASESARDIGRLIEMTRHPEKNVFVMGASYGTWLANRYLQLFPDQPDGIILDGIVPADWSFVEFDAGLDRTGRRLLERCTADPDCSAHLNGDAIAFAETMFEKLGEGNCQQLGMTPALTRLILGISLLINRVPRAYVPALIRRIDRCAWHDQMVLLHLFRGVFEGLGEPESHSPVAQRHVALSELWRDDAPGPQELEDALQDYVMTTEVSASFLRTAALWPVYERDPMDDTFAEYDAPMLMLHGGMDPTMPIERLDELRGFYSGALQTFVLVPDAGHVVVNESECVRSIYLSFLDQPQIPPDTTCIADTPRFSFVGDDSTSVELFGTRDMWGDEVGAVQSILFQLRFRYLALLMAIGVPVIGFLRLPSRGESAVHGRLRFRYGRLAVALGIWLLLSAGFWFGEFVLPLLLEYNAASTNVLLLVLIVVQMKIGYWLVGKGVRSR